MFFTKPGRYTVFIFDVKRLVVFTSVLIALLGVIWWTTKSVDRYSEVASEIKQITEKLEKIQEEEAVNILLSTDQIRKLNKAIADNNQVIREQVETIDGLNKELASIKETINRIRLMGILQNENNAAILAGRPQDIIFIGRNWTISRMPRYLNMSIQDVEWLRPFVKEEGSAVVPPIPSVPN
jgi:hypothetical protein